MKDIPGYEGLYAATEDGQIYSYRRERFMKLSGGNGDYQLVNLTKDKKWKSYYVHRLVALAYLPNPNNLPQINHIDRRRDNNCLSNLEWCSVYDNLKHSDVWHAPKKRYRKKNKTTVK